NLMAFQDIRVRSAAELRELTRTLPKSNAPLKNPFTRLLLLFGMDAVVCEEPLPPILLEKLVFEMAALDG
ncbi:hypothetical protein, partial [Pseudomonas aeruginosa]|uniref:hypothetical protein n=1 Tax=Pseudomonas aeruginosa TaxID=287 RepID=UPI001C546EE0